MSYKEFVSWCNKRSCDGCWSMPTAGFCIQIMEKINKKVFWKRNKEWENTYKNFVMTFIVIPIEKKIKESDK